MYARHHSRFSTFACVLLLIGAGTSHAQLVNWTNAGTSDWNINSNWSGPSGNFVPDAQFGESANISNGGTAEFNGAPTVGGVILGQTAGQSGTLVIKNGAAMSVVANAGSTGAVVVGQAGSGTLKVENGGSISAVSLTAGGGQTSSIRLIGPGASVTTSSGATLSANNTLISEITSAAFTPISVTGNAALGGNFKVEFTGGYTPTVGTSWSIIDATTTSGSFTNFDTSGLSALPLGQQLTLTTLAGGLGTLVQLRLEQVLILNVNRVTGAVSMSNAVGGAPIAIDGYTIVSSAGSLNAATWSSLHDQTPANWVEANPSNNRLSELRTVGTATINGGSSLLLGNAYLAANPAFGIPVEDLTFQYEKSDGSVVNGQLNFTGGVKKYNNLVLEINASGTAQIINDSLSSVNIEGYTIASSDGSLLASNGNWNSLDDQNAAGGNWIEANGSASRLSEVKSGGLTTFNSTNGINIGHIFNTLGSQTGITFEFLIAGQSVPFAGGVAFRNLSSSTPIGSGGGVPGDYNNDHIVNASDYVVWRNNLGQNVTLPNDTTAGNVGPEDYGVWRSHFGMTSGSGAGALLPAAVPEPTVAYLLLSAIPLLALCKSGRSGRFVR